MASKSQSKRIIDTTEGSLLEIIGRLAFPAALQALLINIYAFNDFVFVGLYNDKDATAALSACFAILIIKYAFIRIMPTGGTTLIAQFSGAKNKQEVANTARQSLLATLASAILIGITFYYFLTPIVQAANVTDTVAIRTEQYLRILFLAAPTFGLMIMIGGMFRARGDTKTPLFLEISSLIVNTFLNWVFVLGNLGFDAMGIEGAAIATVLSRGIPAIVGLILVFKGKLDFKITAPLKQWIPSLTRLKKMFKIGLFDSLGSMFYGFTYLALNRLAGEISSAAQGGLGAGLRGIEWIGFSLGDGFAQAAMIIVGQNIGAQQFERAKKGYWLVALLSFITSQVVGFIFVLFPEDLCRIVTQDPETLRYAGYYVSIVGWVQGLCSFEMTTYGALIGAARSEITFMISTFGNLIRIPFVTILTYGLSASVTATLWAFFGIASPGPKLENDWALNGFEFIAYAIAGTTIIKAGIYFALLKFGNPFEKKDHHQSFAPQPVDIDAMTQ